MKKQGKHLQTILAAFIVFSSVLVVVFGEVVLRFYQEHEHGVVQQSLYSTASLLSQEIQQNVSVGILATETLHSFLVSSDYDLSQFETWGRSILERNPNVNTVQLAPGGVVSYIRPMAGNEGAIGHDLLKDKRRDDGALKAIESRELTFVGPVKLIQNGKYAVIARKPVFSTIAENEGFWGFTIALIYIEDIIPEAILDLEQDGIAFFLRGADPDVEENPSFIKSGDYVEKNGLIVKIRVPNGTWDLGLSQSHGGHDFGALFRAVFVLIGLSLASFLLVQQRRMWNQTRLIVNLNEKLEDLSLHDELTQLDNRRSGYRVLRNMMSQALRYKNSLSIAAVDLDHFKRVNDSFGHLIGDKMLQHVSTILKPMLRENDVLIRLGGDEFLCLLPLTDLSGGTIVANKLREHAADTPLVWEGKSIGLSLSVGLAEWNREDSIDDLLSKADQQLYRAKSAGRNVVKY